MYVPSLMFIHVHFNLRKTHDNLRQAFNERIYLFVVFASSLSMSSTLCVTQGV